MAVRTVGAVTSLHATKVAPKLCAVPQLVKHCGKGVSDHVLPPCLTIALDAEPTPEVQIPIEVLIAVAIRGLVPLAGTAIAWRSQLKLPIAVSWNILPPPVGGS